MPKPLFVAVGAEGLRMASRDGREWQHVQTGREGEVWRAVAFGSGVFVAIGSYGGDNIMGVSSDGQKWKTTKHDAKYSRYFRGLTFGAGRFVALGGDPGSVGSSKPFVSISRDGETWEAPLEVVGKNILRRAAFGRDRFVGIGDRGRRAGSVDGKEWKDDPAVEALDTMVDVAFGGGVFVGVGLHGLRMRTVDGTTWTDRVVGDEGDHLNTIVHTGDRFVAIGTASTCTSTDGIVWKSTANDKPPATAVWGGGLFVGSTWKGRILTSTDGVRFAETFRARHSVEAIASGEV